MESKQSSEQGDYPVLLQVPVATFRDFIMFITKNELWDEATALLQAHGLESVAMGRGHVDLICNFVEAKEREFEMDPEKKDTARPRCSIIKPPPKTPKSPGPKTAPQ